MMNDIVFIIPDRSIQYTEDEILTATAYSVTAMVEIIKAYLPNLPWYPSETIRWRKSAFSDISDFILLGPPVPSRQPIVCTIYLTGNNLEDIELRNIISTVRLFDDLQINEANTMFSSTFSLAPQNHVGEICNFYISLLETNSLLLNEINYYVEKIPKGGALSLVK